MIIEENIRHLSFREHISWQRRLARSKGCTKGYYPTEIKKSFLHDNLLLLIITSESFQFFSTEKQERNDAD
ncbi:Uncharacterised protein [Segatella copri]|nr:Uncharacterised protein [Segatella copri]